MAYNKAGHTLINTFLPTNLIPVLERHAKVRGISRSAMLSQIAIRFVEANEAELLRLEEEAWKWTT